MNIRAFTRLTGIVFLLLGFIGMIPGLTSEAFLDDPDLVIDSNYGRIFGVYPINVFHNIVHLGLGVWGIVAAREVIASRRFCRATAIFYGALTLLGIIPITNTLFGLVPIFGNAIWIHAIFAGVTAYYGYFRPQAKDQIIIERRAA